MKGIIQIGNPRSISQASTDAWDKAVWASTHFEYKLQVQNYPEYKQNSLYTELVKLQPKASRLSYMVSAGAINYLKNLGGKMPGVLNNLGQPALSFKQYRFELVESHLTDASLHSVQLYLLSEPLVWIDTIGDQLLIAPETATGEYIPQLIRLGNSLSIDSFKPIEHDTAKSGHHLFESGSYTS